VSKRWLDQLPADLRRIVVEEGRKLQPWLVEAGIREDIEQSRKWRDRGGEIITWSPQDMAELKERLKTVGEEVSKANPEVKAFYEKVLAVSAQY
jgi:C4-dicarboxylate-binding protein DctP